MKTLYLLIAGLLMFSRVLIAQVAINADGSLPDNSAMLHVKSFNKGVLIPQMTLSQIGAIPNPANGLVVFCTSNSKFYTYIAIDSTWKELLYGSGTITHVPDCGNTLTINHVAGVIAPVTKTVTYGTVSNIPGEPTKCWITSNLGADHQATAVNDATEASAGWYWQFNQKQGYKHDGTTRTPNTTWFSFMTLSDWQATNDACTSELGYGWHVPTFSEWYNVVASGNWINWNGPWNSSLKLHAAGSLDYTNGTLASRGTLGRYWSRTFLMAYPSYMSGTLNFNSGSCATSQYYIPAGYSLRCLRDSIITPAAPTVTTAALTEITQTTVTAGGNVLLDGGNFVTERGVCWSESQSPTIIDTHTSDGSGMGPFISSITGLSTNTTYYVRAYATNSVGTGYGNEVSFTTSVSVFFTCGSPITITHIAGDVAPVSKTVTYGTVRNVPGETAKCWITQNLGSDNQAIAVNDNTEASAGWYWQFNRKQGYKHDGTTRTPNTTWISSINENLDWQAANDPCLLELGSGWRLPTYTEWYNVDNTGGWTDWTGPWNSGLKLHAAGYLIQADGSLDYRGSWGHYWSSTQYSTTIGWGLNFNSGDSNMSINNKARGFTLRCLRD